MFHETNFNYLDSKAEEISLCGYISCFKTDSYLNAGDFAALGNFEYSA